MAEFAYNNAKNTSSDYTLFELNCGYHPRIFYKEDVEPRSKSKSANELSAKLRKLIIVCQENLDHAQELPKRGYNKGIKPKSYAPDDKVWLNSKYIKTKRNQLPRKWRIYDVFHVSLLEQDITRKRRVDENNATELDAGNDSSDYGVEVIRDSAVYARESKSGHLPGLYYLVSWKGYLEEENTWEPYSAVQHLRKLISSFHKDHPDKPTATSEAIDTAPPMARPTIKPAAKPTVKPTAPKRKRGRPANSSNKQTKKSCVWFLSCFWLFYKVQIIHTLKPLA